MVGEATAWVIEQCLSCPFLEGTLGRPLCGKAPPGANALAKDEVANGPPPAWCPLEDG